jgi:hypothetical protein
LIGKDATGQAEFIICGHNAHAIIGLSPSEVIQRNYDSTSAIANTHIAASQIRRIPIQFNHVSSMLCKFVVSVSADSFRGKWPSFLVNSVESFESVPVPSPMVHSHGYV